MNPALHVIAKPGSGRLATIAHPRAAAWPADLLHALAGAGAQVLVSALSAAEQHRLGLDGTAEAAAAAGLEFVSFPAADGSIPRQEAARVVGLARRLAVQVRNGQFVVAQCFGGIGRSTLLACTTLTLLGIAPGDALRRVAGDEETLPVTRDWLFDFAESHGTNAGA